MENILDWHLMTPREFVNAGAQYVSYNVFVPTLAILIGLGGSIFGAASWVYNRDQQASDRIDMERWKAHAAAEVIRDKMIDTTLGELSSSVKSLDSEINDKLDEIREMVRK